MGDESKVGLANIEPVEIPEDGASNPIGMIETSPGVWEFPPKVSIEWHDPESLSEQVINAHRMERAKFDRLVENIRSRGMLESVPFCAEYEGRIEIVSGHHRVRASIVAGLPAIPVIVDRTGLTRSQIIAKQIAHNALVGHDDPEILSALLDMIDGVDNLLETGVEPSLLDVPEADTVSLHTPKADFDWKIVQLMFLPKNIEDIRRLVESSPRNSALYLAADGPQFLEFMDALTKYQSEFDILNASAAVSQIVDAATNQIEMHDWWDEKADAPKTEGYVPIAAVLGQAEIPVEAAVIIKRALDVMLASKQITKNGIWKGLECMAANYIAGEAQNGE